MQKFYRHVESGEVYPEFHSPAGYQAANPKLWEPCDANGNPLEGSLAPAVTDAVAQSTTEAQAVPKRGSKVKTDADSAGN